jgi:hypothetical protein
LAKNHFKKITVFLAIAGMMNRLHIVIYQKKTQKNIKTPLTLSLKLAEQQKII